MEAIKTAWDFFQNEILGMHWLNRLISTVLNACGLDTTTRIGGSVQFFIYDTIKIMVLLGILILIISYIQSYFPPERTKKILGRFHGIWANILAALLGTVTPFCSCSSIPLFIGFTSAGLPLGVTFSFLISSPMVDLGSLVLLGRKKNRKLPPVAAVAPNPKSKKPSAVVVVPLPRQKKPLPVAVVLLQRTSDLSRFWALVASPAMSSTRTQ